MKQIQSTKELKDIAIQIRGTIRTYWPQFKKVEFYTPTVQADKVFGTNNGVLAFVDEGVVYVIPTCRCITRLLADEGYRYESIYVPFSNWDYPADEEQKWRGLWSRAKAEHHREFLEDCKKFAEKKGFGELDDETLGKCMIMPDEGLHVTHPYFDTYEKPLVSGDIIDCTVANVLGTYGHNNGVVSFVYIDGTTRLAKGYWIIGKLQEAGYKDGSLYVPLSNGEHIEDYYYRTMWEQIVSE